MSLEMPEEEVRPLPMGTFLQHLSGAESLTLLFSAHFKAATLNPPVCFAKFHHKKPCWFAWLQKPIKVFTFCSITACIDYRKREPWGFILIPRNDNSPNLKHIEKAVEKGNSLATKSQ